MSGTPINYDTLSKKLSNEELAACAGTNRIVFNNLCGKVSVYKLLEINGQKLPNPEMHAKGQDRSYESINQIWKILQKKYDQEIEMKREKK